MLNEEAFEQTVTQKFGPIIDELGGPGKVTFLTCCIAYSVMFFLVKVLQ